MADPSQLGGVQPTCIMVHIFTRPPQALSGKELSAASRAAAINVSPQLAAEENVGAQGIRIPIPVSALLPHSPSPKKALPAPHNSRADAPTLPAIAYSIPTATPTAPLAVMGLPLAGARDRCIMHGNAGHFERGSWQERQVPSAIASSAQAMTD